MCIISIQVICLTPYCYAMIPIGHGYIVKNKAPRTEPSGTPDNKTQRKVQYGRLYQMQQTGLEEQVILAYLDQLTS